MLEHSFRFIFFIVMEVCSGDYGLHMSKLVESIENGKSNVWRSKKSLYLHEEIITAQRIAAPIRLYSFETEFKHSPHYTASFWMQLRVLMKRNAIKLLRDRVII